jgi:hypothetical protein
LLRLQLVAAGGESKIGKVGTRGYARMLKWLIGAIVVYGGFVMLF